MSGCLLTTSFELEKNFSYHRQKERAAKPHYVEKIFTLRRVLCNCHNFLELSLFESVL